MSRGFNKFSWKKKRNARLVHFWGFAGIKTRSQSLVTFVNMEFSQHYVCVTLTRYHKYAIMSLRVNDHRYYYKRYVWEIFHMIYFLTRFTFVFKCSQASDSAKYSIIPRQEDSSWIPLTDIDSRFPWSLIREHNASKGRCDLNRSETSDTFCSFGE